ncbi:DUF305 domain-containing protein [Spongiactinospora gelatinilytica]|uniref:DUF305 domain-containing protein n=1 Tax=Spongiactinospora gelatinilytica TaxID=2666298 RepID=A0A2W2GVK2_9ACTN|nr:DUF305 domain-containing protein [Spongiactinospora gelatinilytica]PZG41298.1 DUF305 domain-containing protein [Spongiactinospora gelatinilytica]
MKRLVTALSAATALLLAGCAGGAVAGSPAQPTAPTAGAEATGPVNAADVMFLQMMIPHHRQSIEIARLAGKQAADPAVKTMAEAIAVTQAAEVFAMSERLYGWNQPLTVGKDAHAAHGGMPEIAKKAIARLRKAPPGEFDRDFLQMLIAHHDDGVQMSNTEVSTGANPATVEQARKLSQALSAQIDHMLDLLTRIDPVAGRTASPSTSPV